MREVERLLGIYRADGGAVGELRYVVGTLLGAPHCSLCDITHGPLRRKREWDAYVATLPVPFELAHRNDAVARPFAAKAACVLALVGGSWETVLDDATLTSLDGSVASFALALERSLAQAGVGYTT